MYMYIMGAVIKPHHLQQMLLYSYKHLLPTSSALHHGDPLDMPHTMELHVHCPKESNTCTPFSYIHVHMYVAVVVHEEG